MTHTKGTWLAGLCLAITLSGCGRPGVPALPDPLGSNGSQAQPQAPVAHLPAGVVATSIRVTAQDSRVAVGSSIRIQVLVQLSNGQIVSDPLLCRWSVSDPQAATVDRTGLVTGLNPRSAVVRAQVGDAVAEVALDVVPTDLVWQQVTSPVTTDLFAVRMLSRQDGWAVGARGTILRWVSQQWVVHPGATDAGVTHRGMSFSDPGTGWIVGHRGTEDRPQGAVALAFAGQQWVPVPVPATGGLRAVATIDRDRAWAVGADASGRALIMRWNGRSWIQDTSWTGKGALNAIQMMGSEGWAVGRDGNNPLVLHFDGSRWSKQNLPFGTGLLESGELKGIHMLNGDQGYAVGWSEPTVGFRKGLVFRFDARGQSRFQWSQWQRVEAADAGVPYLAQATLNAVSMLSGNEGWMLGETVTPRQLLPVAPVNDLFANLLTFDGNNYRPDTRIVGNNLSKECTGIHLLPEGQGAVCGRQGYLMMRMPDFRQVYGAVPSMTSRN
ncbi:MAG: Ig-like domain-containing protein [Candidatus Sericytochromatia bacterium]|nr:Ig-like domain-containing protein [Candidatus Sericytochromatia bacterium]